MTKHHRNPLIPYRTSLAVTDRGSMSLCFTDLKFNGAYEIHCMYLWIAIELFSYRLFRGKIIEGLLQRGTCVDSIGFLQNEHRGGYTKFVIPLPLPECVGSSFYQVE